MVYRVIQWATGRVGAEEVRGMVRHPDLRLVGALVHSADKEGCDLGELCGLDPVGVRTTRDKQAVLAIPADCVCYMPGRTWLENPMQTVDELAWILRSGKNVVSAAWPALVNPAGVSAAVFERLHEACLAGESSLYTSGIQPGHGSLGLAFAALTVSQDVRSIHTYAIQSYASFANPEMMKVLGFGQPDAAHCALLQPGYTTNVYASSLSLLAQAMGVELDEIVEDHTVIYAAEPFDIAFGHIAAGTVSGMRYSVEGKARGVTRVTIEHVTKLRDGDFPEVTFEGGGYRVEVEGEPGIRLDMEMSSARGDSNNAAFIATAMAVVNAIPRVCEAPPGVVTSLDLPPHPSKSAGSVLSALSG